MRDRVAFQTSKNKQEEKQMSKETKTTKTVNTVAETAVAKKTWTRHVKHYYVYDQTKGFLCEDKTFKPVGDVRDFSNVLEAKSIASFLGAKVLTVVE